MKAVIYARFSSHNQSEVSIKQQVDACRRYAAEHDWEVVEVYADEAISGRTDKRPAYQRMMRDLTKKKFDRIIAYKTSRIARDVLNALKFEEKIDKYGVQSCYVMEEYGENAAGRFMLRLMLNMNQFYSENLAEDVRRGMRDNAMQNLVVGSLPYGYRKGEDKHYEIVPEQAAVVREIFERVANGEMFISIFNDLNARGIKTAKGNKWNKNSLSKMIHNERYIGTYIYMDIRHEDAIPAIVDKELFWKVQAYCEVKPKAQGRRRKENNMRYLLTGKLICGECGNKMTGHAGTSNTSGKHYYYACSGKEKCGQSWWPKDELEEMVTRYAIENALSDEVIKYLADSAEDFVKEEQKGNNAELIQAELKAKQDALSNCMKAIESGIIASTILERIKQLEAEIADLQHQLTEIKANTFTFNRNEFIYALERFRGGDPADKQYQQLIIGTLIKQVTLYGDHLELDFYTDFNNQVRISSPQCHQPRTIRTKTTVVHVWSDFARCLIALKKTRR